MKRSMIVALPFVLLSAIIAIARLQATPATPMNQSDDKLKSFMQLKLDHTKGIIEGLATENFVQIAKEVQSLNALSLQSSWNTYTTPEYLSHSSDFRRAMDVILKGARDENLDRAALGYVNLTVQCIECHRYLRQNSQNKRSAPK